MKSLLFILTLLLSFNLFADNSLEAQLSDQPSTLESTPYSVEPSYSISSINDGSQFMSVALTARLFSWFRVGVEGDLPADFDRKAQIYMLRLLGRIPLLQNENNLYLQGSIAAGFLNTNLNATAYRESFGSLEALIGYTRDVGGNWSLGGKLGAFTASNSFGEKAIGDLGTSQLYNRLTLTGAYAF